MFLNTETTEHHINALRLKLMQLIYIKSKGYGSISSKINMDIIIDVPDIYILDILKNGT